VSSRSPLEEPPACKCFLASASTRRHPTPTSGKGRPPLRGAEEATVISGKCRALLRGRCIGRMKKLHVDPGRIPLRCGGGGFDDFPRRRKFREGEEFGLVFVCDLVGSIVGGQPTDAPTQTDEQSQPLILIERSWCFGYINYGMYPF
jgi:hypothetical protein